MGLNRKHTYLKRTEYHEQCAVIDYIKTMYPWVLLIISPSGNKLRIGAAMKFKRMGLVRGISDLIFLNPRKGFNGMCLELKRAKGGQLSIEQKGFLEKAEKNGYYTAVARGFDEARAVIDWYFGDGTIAGEYKQK